VGREGAMGVPGLGAEPLASSPGADGSGWRGPDKICPGFGAGGVDGREGLGAAGAGAAGRPGANTIAGGDPEVGLAAGCAPGPELSGGCTGRPARGGRSGATGRCSSAAGASLADAGSVSFCGSAARASGDCSTGAIGASKTAEAVVGSASSSMCSAPFDCAPPAGTSGASYSGTSCP
jgi:hypothetical protein